MMFRLRSCLAVLVVLVGVGQVLATEPVNLALGKPVTGTGYLDTVDLGVVFPFDNVTDGRLNDTGVPYDYSYWLTPEWQTGHVTIDLEEVYKVEYIWVQNTHNRWYNDRGTKDFHIGLSTNNADYSTVAAGTLGFDVTDPIDIVEIDIDDQLARYVRFHVDTFYQTAQFGGGGLNEIWVFGENQIIPEPSTLILLTMGAVGLLAYGWRRKFWGSCKS